MQTAIIGTVVRVICKQVPRKRDGAAPVYTTIVSVLIAEVRPARIRDRLGAHVRVRHAGRPGYRKGDRVSVSTNVDLHGPLTPPFPASRVTVVREGRAC